MHRACNWRADLIGLVTPCQLSLLERRRATLIVAGCAWSRCSRRFEAWSPLFLDELDSCFMEIMAAILYRVDTSIDLVIIAVAAALAMPLAANNNARNGCLL
jgi:hypothetical protein